MPELSVDLLRNIGAVGLIGVVGLIVLLGWARTATIDSWQFAADRFRVDFPDMDVLSGVVSTDRDVALLELTDGNRRVLGAVAVFGDKWVTRLLTPPEYGITPSPEGLDITSSDITTPGFTAALDRGTAEHWLAKWTRLEGAHA